MNEQYFENICTIDELNIAERNGFNVEFKTNRPEMPGAILLHESARKCNVVLLAYLISDRNMDINQLDEDEYSSLGFVLNDDLLYEIKSGEITTVNDGCNDASKSDFDLPKFIKFQLQIETCAWESRVRKRNNKREKGCFLTGIGTSFGEEIKK
jgi:hypothetical protein